MDPARHLELLRLEGARLAAVPADALDAPVPALPDWTVERVVRHVGKVHRWVTGALAVGPDGEAPAAASLPKGPACLEAYAEALDQVARALEATDPDETSWTFVGPSAAAFWMRRQAHEVAVHRIDAADAVHEAGGPPPAPFEPDGAADGVDEWAEVFLATRWHQRFGDLPDDLHGRSVRLTTTDGGPDGGPTTRRITLRADGAEVDLASDADADTDAVGEAGAVLLAAWRRRPLDGLAVSGDEALLARLLDVARF